MLLGVAVQAVILVNLVITVWLLIELMKIDL